MMCRHDDLDACTVKRNTVTDVIVIGAGPAGAVAALRAADLGARTIAGDQLCVWRHGRKRRTGSSADPGSCRRLIREARNLGQYGIAVGEPVLDYPRLAGARARGRRRCALRTLPCASRSMSAGVTVHERAGAARFADPHTIVTETGLRLQADKIIICVGGVSRRLPIPGLPVDEHPQQRLGLDRVPPSMLVIGGGATGVQVASIFNAFGSRVELFETGPRILSAEDEDVAAAVAAAFREAGIVVHENFGAIDSFEKTSAGVRMNFSKDGKRESAEAAACCRGGGLGGEYRRAESRRSGRGRRPSRVREGR